MGAQFLAMAGAQVVGGLITAYQTNRVAKEQERLARGLQSELDALEANRQEIIDPSRNIVDRSGMIQNQMANLQVATQAAEFQAEEADVALANTLATARQTGLGAGGATALAQAALRSKRDISSSIEQQEARNILLRAQGAQTAEQRRLSEGERVDRARMAGEQFTFAAREAREVAKLDRTSNLLDQANARAMANKQASQAAIAGAIGAAAGAGIGSALGMGSTPKSQSTAVGGTKAARPFNATESTPTGEAEMASALAKQTEMADILNPRATVVGGFRTESSPTGEAAMASALARETEMAKSFNPRALTPSPFGYDPFMVPGAGSNEFNASQAYPNRPSFYTRYTRQGVDQYDPNTLKYYKF
jgi:hypothetical protein